jgi:hypothetical protein
MITFEESIYILYYVNIYIYLYTHISIYIYIYIHIYIYIWSDDGFGCQLQSSESCSKVSVLSLRDLAYGFHGDLMGISAGKSRVFHG